MMRQAKFGRGRMPKDIIAKMTGVGAKSPPSLIALLCTLAVPSALLAAQYTYTWTWSGAGDGASWTEGANWSCSPDGSGYDYPQTYEDVALFNLSLADGVVVTARLDTAVAIHGVYQKGNTPVCLTATGGATLGFGFSPGRKAEQNSDGLVVDDGKTLILDLPILLQDRFDSWSKGTIYWMHSVTNKAPDPSYTQHNSGRQMYLGGVATNYFTGNLSVLCNGSNLSFGFGSATDGRTAHLFQTDRARVDARTINLGDSRTAPNAIWRQDGDETVVNLTDNLVLGNDANTDAWSTSTWHLVRGTLTASRLDIGKNRPGRYLQEGGTATFAMIVGGVNARSFGSFELADGRFNYTGNATAFALPDNDRVSFRHSGGTFALSQNFNFTFPVHASGAPVLEVPSGTTCSVSLPPDVAPGTSFTKTGAGTLQISTDIPAVGSLTVAAGEVKMGISSKGQNAFGGWNDYTPWRVSIKNGAKFRLRTATANIFQPMDLEIADGGQFSFEGTRNAVFAHSYKTNGVSLPRGRYAASSTTHAYCTVNDGSHVIVPYTWTGGGDGVSWGDTANWEDGVVPVGSSADSYADLSRATNITFSSNIAIGGILYAPNGRNKKLVLSSASKYFSLYCNDYKLSCLVRPDATLEFDCKVLRVGTCVLTGGGTFVFDKYVLGVKSALNPSSKGWPPCFSVNGTLIYRNATDFVRYDNKDAASSSYCRGLSWWANQEGSDATVVFEGADTNLEFDRLVYSASGFSGLSRLIQRGGARLTLADLYLNPHRDSDKEYPFTYFLQNGSLVCTEGLYLNKCLAVTSNTYWKRSTGGSFDMTGGTLRTPLMSSECFGNWFYLKGGDAYVGAGGIQRTSDTTDRTNSKKGYGNAQGFNDSPALQLGGVRLHATANFTVTLDTAFTGAGGETEIDTDGHSITFTDACAVTGAGAWRKTGAGTVYLNGTNSFTGVMTVEEGNVVVDAGAVNEAVPAKLVVASASSLDLPAGVNWNVGTLIVDGVAQAAGASLAFGSGTVTVSQPSSLGAGRWVGPATGGDWLAPVNWSDSTPPNGPAAAATLVGTSLADGAQLAFASNLALGALAVDVPGTVTLAATGEVGILFTNTTITVSPQTTLVINAPVTVGKAAKASSPVPVTVTGGGKVVFAQAVVNQAGTTAIDGYHTMNLESPTTIELRDSFSGVKLSSVNATAVWIEDPAEIIVKTGADVAFAASPLSSGRLRITQDGGTVSFVSTMQLTTDKAQQYAYALDSGTLVVANATGLQSGPGRVAFNLNGGVLQTSGIGVPLFSDVPVTLGGAISFAQADAETVSRFDCRVGGVGSLVQMGPGRVAFAGGLPGAEAISVTGGNLVLACGISPTNLTVGVGGTLTVGEAAATTIPAASILTLSRSGMLEIDFDGMFTVDGLLVNGRLRAAGLYDDGTHHPTPLSRNISGAGVLRVLRGKGVGICVNFR